MAEGKLPNVHLAWVEEKKIKEYLLNLNHEVGGPKARFFLKHGFDAERWEVMRDALVQHASTNPLVKTITTGFGTRYTVGCSCPTPDGVHPCIRSVWEMKAENEPPRLITAHPRDK